MVLHGGGVVITATGNLAEDLVKLVRFAMSTGSTAPSGSGEGSGGESSVPKPSLEDVTTGPHGPDRPISDVIARARVPGHDGFMIPQGRWLSRKAGRAGS